MKLLGEYKSIARDMDGNLLVTFAVQDSKKTEEGIRKLEGKQLTIEAKKYSPGRSLNANRLFWEWVERLAEILKADRWEVYLLQLTKYGQYVDVDILPEALQMLKRTYRFVQVLDQGDNLVTARCYIGSSHYDRAEMSRLIEGTKQDLEELGEETWNQEEIDRLVQLWNSQ